MHEKASKNFDVAMYEYIGNELRRARIEKKWSLDRLREELNFTKAKSTLKRYEDGQSRLTMDDLSVLCKSLGLGMNSLISNAKEYAYKRSTSPAEIDEDKHNETLLNSKFTAHEMGLIYRYRNASDKTKKLIRTILDLDNDEIQ